MRHEFAGLTFDGGHVPFTPLRCCNCGMWASFRVAKQLEGLPCR